MKVFFITGLFPKEERANYISQSKGVIQYAADALQQSFMEGLEYYYKDNLTVLSMPHLGGYPKRYKKLFIKNGRFGKDYGIDGRTVGYCNLSLYKRVSQFINLYNAIDDCLKKLPQDEEKVIVVYAIITPYLKAIEEIKHKYKNVKFIIIVPDLPEYMSDNKSVIYTTLKSIDGKIQRKIYTSVDGYVLLTQYMAQRLPIGNKPFVVIEGIYNPKDEQASQESLTKSPYKTIFYAGTLARRYGIVNLIEAFTATTNKDYKLEICGDGNAKQELLAVQKKDNRIIYLGQLDRGKVLTLQREASLLVNPRNNSDEYTAYSFPSKTMEFLASGTPAMLCKMKGIPSEYYNYCFALDHIDSETLKENIERILAMKKEDLCQFGDKARQFILANKNPIVQVSKLKELIDEIISN